MTEIATVDSFGRWGTSVFCENTAIFTSKFYVNVSQVEYLLPTTHKKAFIFGP